MGKKRRPNFRDVDVKGNNKKIMIFNVIVLALAITSILTLALGNFFAIKANIAFDGDEIQEYLPIDDMGIGDVELDELDDLRVNIPLSLQLNGKLLLQSLTGDPASVIKQMLLDQINTLLPVLEDVITTLVKFLAAQFIKSQEQEVKKLAAEAIAEESGVNIEDVTEEEIYQRLEEEYGISESDIDSLNADIATALDAFISGEGDINSILNIVDDSEALDKMITVIVEEEELEEGKSVEETVQEIKDEIRSELEEMTSELSVDGEPVTFESILLTFVNEMADDDFQTFEEAKAFFIEDLLSDIDSESLEFVAIPFKILGAFLLLVILSWAYLVVKIVVKAFAKNKSIGMLAPKLIAWVPYVLLVLVPTILLKNIATIIGKVGGDAAAAEEISSLLTKFNVSFSSLTWVSALSVLVLFIIMFPYRKLRKANKRALKGRR